MLVYQVGAVIAGLFVLVWSADRFVIGAAASARLLGMSPLLVGLTIVSIGTSAPEMFVSTMASLDGAGNLAIGNALGSNITNIALVLGITALVSPIPLKKALLRKELPLLVLISIVGGLTLLDLQLDRFDAAVLLIALAVALYLMFQDSSDSGDNLIDEEEAETIAQTSGMMAAIWLVVGLVALMLSSKTLVWGATGIAQAMGISDLLIGLTIVAIGTSLPELAASIASALKKQHDIAIGNVIGSNTFNLLAVMPIPGLITVTQVDSLALHRDFSVMMALTVALLLLFVVGYRSGLLGRLAGSLLTVSYITYLSYLIYTTSSL